MAVLVAVGAMVVSVTNWPGNRLNPCKSDEDTEAYGIVVTENGGNELALRRSKNWYTPGLGGGKWIGTAANGGPGASDAFEKLDPEKKGCVKFKYPGGVNSESAKLHIIGTGAPVDLKFAMYCVHRADHPDDIKPKYEPIPAVCDRLLYRLDTSVGVRVDSLEFAALGVLSLQARLDSVRARLVLAGVPQIEADSLVGTVGNKGPWYPCASAGCCRAWGM
ncbi:MAG: hypothetical protein IT352_02230 [Gemmatimonadales bacterium]|nr:hypothetical protein [Gemmatimonadales bacterium]